MRALVAKERQVVLNLLREPRFVDMAPAEVYACLLDQDLYLCAIRTMYRILAKHDEVRERRRQLRRLVYHMSSLDVGFKIPCIPPAPRNRIGELERSQMIHDVVATKFELGDIVGFPDIPHLNRVEEARTGSAGDFRSRLTTS
jgi:hypothetical protein